MQYLLTYLVATVLFFTIDMVWLGFIAKDFYRRHLGHLMAEQVNWTAAIIFYLLYIGGILYFAVLPALQNGQGWQHAALNGAILGLLCYATFDLTNLATLKGFPQTVVVIDIIWGAALTGTVATLTYLVSNRFWG